MLIRFVKGWHQYKPGDTTDAIADGVAELLVLRRRAEYMVPQQEVAVVREERQPKRQKWNKVNA